MLKYASQGVRESNEYMQIGNGVNHYQNRDAGFKEYQYDKPNHQKIQGLQKQDSNRLDRRVSSYGPADIDNFVDCEIEQAQCAGEYLYEENDNPIPMAYLQKKNEVKQASKVFQPKLSKSPTPTIYHNTSSVTPTSLGDLRMSQKYPYLLMNQPENQIHQRNPQQPIIPNYNSHKLPNETNNPIKEKKKSISSSTGASNSTNGTFSYSITNNPGQSIQSKNKQQMSSNLIQNQHQQPVQSQSSNSNIPPHKKSQSLYNKKIVDIISGLQQSLGVMANNAQVPNSINNQSEGAQSEGPNKQKALLESALLAQKIAQMTQSMTKVQEERVNPQQRDNSNRRKSAKVSSNGPNNRLSSYTSKNSKAGYKTIDDQNSDIAQKSNQTRISMDFQSSHIRGNSSKSIHQRTKSDQQQPRKKVATTILNNPHPQQIIHHYHQKQKTLLTCSSSSIENMNVLSSIQGSQLLKQESELKYQNYQTNITPGGYIPSTVKNLNKITHANAAALSKSIGSQQNSSNQSSNQTKFSRKQEVATTSLVESTLSDLAIAAKHYHSNVHTSGNASIIGGATQVNSTIENPRQSIVFNQQIQPIPHNGERVSDAKFIVQMNKKANNLIINSSTQGQGEQRLKSAASSPSLHSQVPVKKQQIKSNNVFNFGQQQQQIVTANIKNTQPTAQGKAITSKKKNIIGGKEKLAQGAQHKRSTSDGSSLTKMFHFKQQMLINKIFSQTNNNSAVDPSIQMIKKPPNTSSNVSQINSSVMPSKSKVPSSNLSSKRMSNQENQENLNNNYQSPRLNHKMEVQSDYSSQVSQPKLSQDMKAFLQKFKDKNTFVSNQPATKGSNQQKQLLIQAIQNNNAVGSRTQANAGVVVQDSTGYLSTNSNLSKGTISIKQQNNLKVKSQNLENIVLASDQIKRQSQQIQKVSKPVGTTSHKRAKSDVQKHMVQQTKIQQPHQFAGSKMFFLNLNQPPNNDQSSKVSLERLNQKSQQSLQYQNMIYSARASPQNVKNTYYNFEETQKQGQGQSVNTAQKSFLPTARSDCSNKGQQPAAVMSNQTTLKKHQKNQMNNNRLAESSSNDTPQFNYLCQGEMPRAKLQYTDQNEQLVPSSMYQTNAILQSQQFTKLANMFYGIENTNQSTKLKSQKGNTIYSSCDNNDSIVYSIVNEDQIQHINVNTQFNGSESSLKRLTIQTMDQSPKLKVLPTPKVAQPGAPTIPLLNIKINENQNFMIGSPTNQNHTQSQKNFEEQCFQTFESNMTSMTMNNLTPRSKEKHRLIKAIKVSFNKLKQPIKTTSEFYRIGKMLGKGAFGRVNLAIHKLCEQLVAVKSINKQFLTEDENSKKKVMQEVHILQKTRHQNIVRLYDSFESNKHIVFVMELCAGGDLLNYVRKRRKLKEDVAKYVFKQVVEGLHYCHQKGIVHRDMKLDNLLFDESGIVKICDFGVSKQLTSSQEVMTEQCGTPAYIAPEILKDKGYKGFGVDIWSLGVCLYALLYGTVPFKANNMSELHQLIMKAKYSLKDEKAEISDEAKSLIRALLEPDPNKRITMEQIKKHIWLQEAYEEGFKVEIFTDQEKETIRKDFTYQDMARYRRNQNQPLKHIEQEAGHVLTTEEHLFTEHALDSTQNALLKNCTTKSVILAPFNSTRSHLEKEEEDEGPRPLEIDRNMIADKRIIKYAPRVKDINRQYEMNNNCELDNGVYNQFVKQSTNGEGDKDSDTLLNSMNKNDQPCAPLVSQNSEEEIEAELIKNNQMQSQSQLQTFLLLQHNQMKDEQLLIGNFLHFNFSLDYEIVEKVETYGYPRNFIIESLENFEMNDAASCYFLLDKERQYLEEQGIMMQF